jgi:hypothetical protein
MVRDGTRVDESPSEERGTSALCWAARTVPLVVAIPLVAWMFYLLWVHTTTYVNDPAPLPMLAVFSVPLVFALIAWRWHLVGGVLLSAFAALVIVVPLILTGSDFLLILVGAVLLAGGLLHLIVWWQEKRMQRPQYTSP